MNNLLTALTRPQGELGVSRVLATAGVLYPVWYLLAPDGAVDAWWTWGGVSAALLVSAAVAARWPRTRSLLAAMFPAPWLSTLQLYVLAWLNDMHLFYTVGSAMSVLALAMAIPTQRWLLGYGGFAAALGLTFFALDPDPIKAACWGGMVPVIGIAHQRLGIRVTQQRMEREYRSDLEAAVQKRTREVFEANRQLRREMQERARLEEELRVANKLEAVARLAGGMAHEFNNLLTRVRLYSDLAAGSLPGSHEARADIEEVQRASGHAAELTGQLLTFARGGDAPREAIDLNQAIASSQSMLRHLIGEGRRLDVMLADEVLPVLAERRELEQILVNLTLNARDALPQGGRAILETAARRPDPPLVVDGTEVESVVLVFCDEGIGMDAETRSRAFDPFFTGKPAGTGLGLSVVHGILGQVGGRASIRSEPGKGTQVELHWPRAAGLPADEAPDPAARVFAGRGRRILLVENEVDIRLALERVLREAGYQSLSSGSGEHAIQLASRSEEPIDLLISDVVMPGMGGVELARALCAMRPETKVLLISGYRDAEGADAAEAADEHAFLAKPFEAVDLLEKIQGVLG